jgi:hypothetical protein
MSGKKHSSSTGASSPLNNDAVFSVWKLEGQVREQLRRGVKTTNGSVVALSVGSSTLTYVRIIGNELIVKYVEGCVVVSAPALLAGEEVKVYDATIYNICSGANI